MAKKKTERKASNFKEAIGLQSILKSERTDFLLGMVIALFAVYTFVALFSYINTGAEDQSLLEHTRPGEWLNQGKVFKNYCGSMGAILSYTLVTKNFGYAAFFVPYFLLVSGIKMMQIYMLNIWKWFFGLGIAMIWLSVFDSLSVTISEALPVKLFMGLNIRRTHVMVCLLTNVSNAIAVKNKTAVSPGGPITFSVKSTQTDPW